MADCCDLFECRFGPTCRSFPSICGMRQRRRGMQLEAAYGCPRLLRIEASLNFHEGCWSLHQPEVEAQDSRVPRSLHAWHPDHQRASHESFSIAQRIFLDRLRSTSICLATPGPARLVFLRDSPEPCLWLFWCIPCSQDPVFGNRWLHRSRPFQIPCRRNSGELSCYYDFGIRIDPLSCLMTDQIAENLSYRWHCPKGETVLTSNRFLLCQVRRQCHSRSNHPRNHWVCCHSNFPSTDLGFPDPDSESDRLD